MNINNESDDATLGKKYKTVNLWLVTLLEIIQIHASENDHLVFKLYIAGLRKVPKKLQVEQTKNTCNNVSFDDLLKILGINSALLSKAKYNHLKEMYDEIRLI